MKNKRAFTLVELLISMALLMILISISSPAYQYFFSQRALINSSEQLYQFFRFANLTSVKNNKKVYVHFCQWKNTNIWRMALSEKSSCDCFVKSSCVVNGLSHNTNLSDGQSVFTNSDDITFTGLQASYNPMRFSVNAGSITLSDNNGHQLKVIQSAMRLRICSPVGQQLGYKEC